MVKQFFALGLLIVSVGSFAQNKNRSSGNTLGSIEKHAALKNTFKKGQLDIHLGVGLIPNRYFYFTGSRVTPPLNISAEKAITDNVSLGACFAYIRSVYEHSGYYSYYSNNAWIRAGFNDRVVVNYGVFGARGAFHLAEYVQVENVDLYAGAMLGWAFAKFTYYTDNASGRVNPYKSTGYGGLVGGFYIGGRYRFTEKIGVFCELGYGLSYTNIGLNIKL